MAFTACVTLGVRLAPTHFERIKIDNIDLENKVELLKEEAARKINMPKQGIELIYCGSVLDDDATLSSYGIKSGVMVHVLKKKEEDTPVPVRRIAEADIQQLVHAFRTFTVSHGYREALIRISRPEILENIIAATPGLADDPVAIAIIHDPELLFHMSESETARRIAELHPCLVEAANQIVAAVYESAATNPNQPSTSSGYSYSLDALSDEEEMDSSSSDGTREGQPLSRNQSYSTITSAQLAAAIASATTSSYPSVGNTENGSGGVITNEMFSQAMQQAFANVAPNSQQASTSDEGESIEIITRRLAPQLQQMREMGLTNDVINVQALQATNGDVQAAINLVFSGVISSF